MVSHLRGVVAIDPSVGNRLPPPVVLEEAWANKLTLAPDGQTSIPPGNNTLDFRFTALNFSAPEKLRFRYRLDPFDKDWVDAGTRRTAHYTNMAPGKYSFQVVAANSYGIWDDQGASVRFLLKPHFYQTLWFRLVLLAGVVLLAGSAYWLRVRQLHARAARLKQLADTLQEQANLLNLTHDAIFVMDLEGEIKYWNRGAEERYGWPIEQAIGKDAHHLLKTVFPAPFEQIKEEVVPDGSLGRRTCAYQEGRNPGGGGEPLVFATRRGGYAHRNPRDQAERHHRDASGRKRACRLSQRL